MISLLVVVFWFLSIWIYRDLKKFRSRGVPVRPGLFTGVFFLIFFTILSLGPYALGLLFYSGVFVARSAIPFFQLVLLIGCSIYYFFRRSAFAKRAASGGPPLPPLASRDLVFFLFAFFTPVFLFVLEILFFYGSVRGFG